MKNVVKWIVVVMLVSIDILTPFGNAELYSGTNMEIVENDVEEVIGSDDVVESQEDGDFSSNEEDVEESEQLQEQQQIIEESEQLQEQQDIGEKIELNDEESVLENGEQGEIVEENKVEEDEIEEIIDLQEDISEDLEFVEGEIDEIIEEDKGKLFPKLMVDKDDVIDRVIMVVNVNGCMKYEEKDDGTVKIVGLNTEQEGCNVDLTIPSEIDGKAVSEIGNSAFRENRILQGTLTIPSTVKKINTEAFYRAFNQNAENYLVFENDGEQIETILANAFNDNNLRGVLKIPRGLSGVLNQFSWNKFTGIDFNGANITEIGGNFMKERYSLQGTLTIPGTVKK